MSLVAKLNHIIEKTWIPFLLIVLMAFGFYVRIYGGLYDEINNWIHPDENRMSMACNQIRFTSFESLNPKFFAYGSLPLYTYRIVQEGFIRYGQQLRQIPGFEKYAREFRNIYAVGRLITAILGTLTILLTYLLGKKAYNKRVGLLAAAFLTITVLHVQLSHFMTVDVILTFITMLSINTMMWIIHSGKVRHYLLSGFVWGLALATKLNAAMLIIIFLLCHIAYLFRARKIFALASWKQWVSLVLAFVIAAGTFAVCMPFAFLDFELFRYQMKEESEKVTGKIIPPYMVQYEGTPRYLYQLEQMINWSFGWSLGLLIWFGVLYGVYDNCRRFNWDKFIILTWTAIYFLAVGNLKVKWLRHMLPCFPTLCILGAAVLPTWYVLTRRNWVKAVSIVCIVLCLAGGTIYLIAFLDIYRHWNTRKKASYWIYNNVPRGAKVLDEHWDEGLPHPLPRYSPSFYKIKTMENYEGDSARKINLLVEQLEWADYIFFNSKRLYGSIPRYPKRFPHTGNFYRLLFAEKLGYEIIKTVTSYPTIGSIEFVDDLADESFTVYDHPKATIFKKTEQMSAEQLRALIYDPPEEVIEEMTLERILLARGKDEGGGGWSGLHFGFFQPKVEKEEPIWKQAEIAEKIEISPPKGGVVFNMFQSKRGDQPGQFNEPRDIVYHPSGFLFVVDFRNYRIQKFKKDGTFVMAWGEQGEKFGQFKDPKGICLDSDLNLIVVDTWNQRVQKFNTNGKFLLGFDSQVSFYAPCDAAIDKEGNIYITDTGNARIQKFNNKYEYLLDWGKRGNELGDLREPIGIAVDTLGQVYVGDSSNHRVQVFTGTGTLVKHWSLPTPTQETARHQIYLHLTDDEKLFVSSAKLKSILVYDLNGTMLSFYDGHFKFSNNVGLTVLEDGTVVIVDSGHHEAYKILAAELKPPEEWGKEVIPLEE